MKREIVLLFICFICFSGCKVKGIDRDNAREKAISKSSSRTEIVEGNAVRIKEPGFEAVRGEGAFVKIPKNFPKDIYIEDGARVTVVNTEKSEIRIVYATKRSFHYMLKECSTMMKKNGWTFNKEQEIDGKVIVDFKKGERFVGFMVSADSSLSGSWVSVSYKEGEK